MCAVINRPRPLAKTEYTRKEIDRIAKPNFDFARPTGVVFMVSCPAKSYHVTSTADCEECPFWLGYMPANKRKKISADNIFSVCAHPIGRRIDAFKV